MILDKLFNNRPNVIAKKVLEISAENQKILANNIANAETPGFVAKKLEFEESLQNAIKSGNLDAIKNVETRVVKNLDHPFRMDMNNVDIESEFMAMDENRMRYEMLAAILKKRITFWKSVFDGVK